MTDVIDDIEARAAARIAAVTTHTPTQRRLAHPEDYVWDKAQEEFWDLKDGTKHSEKAVDASIPIELWRVEVVEGDEAPPADAPRGRGRPRARRERLIPPSRDIARIENDQTVEGSTWWPGEPQLIHDIFIDSNGWRPAQGRRIYNKYLPPPEMQGDAARAEPWVLHIKKLWPDKREHDFFFDYCAHMVQCPDVKCNAAIVLSGTQGIGKDAALYPVKAAIGNWNTKGIDPDELFSPYKPWLETLMLVVDEVRPSKDEHQASSAYNILKPIIVAPPDTLPLNDKYAKLRYIINRVRVFITTNDWMSMYIPPEDRRMFMMHSTLAQRWHEKEGNPTYFRELFAWFEAGGAANVAAWLKARDLSAFDPKAQVTRTAGWSAVSASWGEPEDCVSQAIDHLGKPPVVFGQDLASPQFDHQDELAGMLKSPRKIAHRMTKAGYTQVSPPDGEKRWTFRVDGKVLQARYTFVRAELANEQKVAIELVRKHGEELLSKARVPLAAGAKKEGF